MRKTVLLLALAATAIAAIIPLAGHALERPRTPAPGEDRLVIVATTAMIADVVRNVAGDKAEVSSLMGEGTDPHLYRPTRTDTSKLLAAHIVFYNGLHLEGQMVEFFEKLEKEKPVHAVAAMLPEEVFMSNAEGDKKPHDPHIWMDVSIWIGAAHGIAKALAQHDPSNSGLYLANAEKYATELKKLDDYMRSSLSSVPEKSRALITAHDAFGYMGRAYGIEVVGIQGISTESEAGLKRIEEIVDLLVKRNIPAVFVESSVSDRNVRALIEGAAAKGHTVKIGGTLYSDAMGSAGTYEGTYIGMLDHNATIIARALGGKAPERGMQDKLSETVN